MKPKDYLLQIQKAKYRIRELELEILEIREAMTSLSHSERSGVGSSNPQTKSPQEKLMGKLISRQDQLADEQCYYFDQKRFIVDQIHSLDNPVHVQILYARYVEGKRLEQIAADLNYSYDHIRRWHGRALTAFGSRWLKDATQCHIRPC